MQRPAAEAAEESPEHCSAVRVEFDRTAFLPAGYRNDEVDSHGSSDSDDFDDAVDWQEVDLQGKSSAQPVADAG